MFGTAIIMGSAVFVAVCRLIQSRLDMHLTLCLLKLNKDVTPNAYKRIPQDTEEDLESHEQQDTPLSPWSGGTNNAAGVLKPPASPWRDSCE